MGTKVGLDVVDQKSGSQRLQLLSRLVAEHCTEGATRKHVLLIYGEVQMEKYISFPRMRSVVIEDKFLELY